MTYRVCHQQSNRLPFNLTSETVHRIIKSQSLQLPACKKEYPTAKYETQEMRSSIQISFKKKLKETDMIFNFKKQLKNRAKTCKTQLSKLAQFFTQSKDAINRRQSMKIPIPQFLIPDKKQAINEPAIIIKSRSSEKYLQKVNKIKIGKQNHYMKNKFAINAKRFETTLCKSTKFLSERERQRTENQTKMQTQEQKTQSHNFFQESVNNEVQNEIKTEQNTQENEQNIVKCPLKGLKSKKVSKLLMITKRDIQQHPADVRLERMRNHLNKILLSFGCKHEAAQKELPPFSRNSHKHKYYVGGGNNKNLIISVMKKRWWWTEANFMNQADFVWTQLKQQKVLQTIPKLASTRLFTFTKNEKNQKHLQNTLSAKIKITGIKTKEENDKLFHPRSHIKINQNKCPAQLKNNLKTIEIPNKVHNHYEGNAMIGNKKALFKYFSLYCEFKNLNRYHYIPLTFHISNRKCPQIEKLGEAVKENPNSYWLIKPGQNSNRGNGISIANSFKKIKQRIEKLTSNSTLIVQKYIDNLFLFNSRKFDIRTYMLAVTIGGITKYYWHDEGYLRTSSFHFNLKNYDDIFVHLTNDAIQCQSQSYSKFQEGNKISYRQFQRYLQEKYMNKNYSIKEAHKKMKNIAEIAIEATYSLINYSHLEFGFEIFGLDFILDKDFNPWLIEINTNPCLELSSTCLKNLIPRVIQNTIRIALDPVFPPCSDFPRTMSSFVPDNIFHSNSFSLIFDEIYDRNFEWQQKLLSQPLQVYEGEEQQFANDGQLLQLQLE